MVAALAAAMAAVGLLGASPAFTVGPRSDSDPLWRELSTPLQQFLGERGGGYVLPEEPVWVQVDEAMSGPPGDMLVFDDSARMLWACRLHSCDEKGAVVLSRANKVQAVGLINFHCRFIGDAVDMRKPPRLRKSTCDSFPTVTTFVRRVDNPREPGAYSEALQHWADAQVGYALPREVVWID
ncbi:MAG: hypothetical protein ABW360_11295 [Phenylobacterium sp.]